MADRTSSFPVRIKDYLLYYVGGTYRIMNEKPVFLWAQAVAFKALVSIVPIVILATGLLGQILRSERAFESVAEYLRNFLPSYRSDQLIEFLEQFANSSRTVTLIGVVGLLFIAMTVFSTLRTVIASVFQEEWHYSRSILHGYAFDVRMVVQVGLFFLLSLGLSLGMQTLNAAGTDFLRKIGLDYAWVTEGWGRIYSLLGLLLPLLLSVAMFFQLFYFVPKPHPPRHSALAGALVTAVLWDLAKFLFALYATRVGRFERYSPPAPGPEHTDGNIPLAIGSFFGLILAFVFWIYYSGLVMTIGAIITLLSEKRHRFRKKHRQVRARRPWSIAWKKKSKKPENPADRDSVDPPGTSVPH